jgi:hypothetical protein
MRRVLLAAAVVVGVSGVGTGTSHAAPDVCPPSGGWVLSSARHVLPDVDVGDVSNRDGDPALCYKVNRGLSKKSVKSSGINTMVVIDNHVPAR